MRILISTVCITLFSLIVFAGCNDGPTGSGTFERPPKPVVTGIPDGAVDVSPAPILRWDVPVIAANGYLFDVYFGRTEHPERVMNATYEHQYSPELLKFGETYFWKVVTRGEGGTTNSSPLLSFTVMKQFRYPLHVGNRWEYTPTQEPPVIAEGPWPFYVTVIDEDAGDDGISYLVTVYEDGPFVDPFPSQLEYFQREEGLYQLGGTFSGPAPSPAASGMRDGQISFAGCTFTGFRELQNALGLGAPTPSAALSSADIDQIPLTFAYPLEEHTEWTYVKAGDGFEWDIDKHIEGSSAKVTVPAGTFKCWEIEWLYDLDGDGKYDTDQIQVTDYVCGIGLVKRSIRIPDLHIAYYDGGITEVIDVVFSYDLTDYELFDEYYWIK